MNFTTFSIGIIFLFTLCALSSSQVTRCVFCESKTACSRRNLQRINCTQATANYTNSYLDVHYQGVYQNATANGFQCIRDNLGVAMGDYHYRGCAFNNVQVCQLRLRDYHMTQKYKRDCIQCQDRDLCNPAARAHISSIGVAAAVVIAVLGKFSFGGERRLF